MSTTVDLDVRNASGLHARPAAVFVRAAAGFRSDVRIRNLTTDSLEVNAKSIIGVLSIGVLKGHRLRLTISGEDEADAADTLRGLVTAGLGEPVEPFRG
jgi:phosphotransferase system HPr (HPr) family protein